MTPVEVKLNGSKVKLKEGMMLYCASHGPGKVVSVETKEYLGEKITFCEMRFDKDDMKILTPIDKMKEMGMRTIISKEVAKKILESVLSKPAKSAKGIWTKRIVECQTKLDSGSALLVAEVVRDLFAGMKDPNKSYGERVLFDKAFDRFVYEYSLALNITIEEANKEVLDVLEATYALTHKNDVDVEEAGTDDDFSDEDLDELADEDDDEDEARKSA